MAGRGIRPKTSSEVNSQAATASAFIETQKPRQASDRHFDCLKCARSITFEDVFQLSTCLHRFCRNCARTFLLDWHTLRCPLYPRCHGEMPVEDALLIVDEGVLEFCTFDSDFPSEESSNSSSNSPDPDKQFECFECRKMFPTDFVFSMTTCEHQMCRTCASEVIGETVRTGKFPITCPVKTCSKVIDPDDITLVLNEVEISMFKAGGGAKKKTFNCALCSEIASIEALFNVGNTCSHQLCRDCASEYVSTKTRRDARLGVPFRCPVSNCQGEIDFENIEMVLDFSELQLDEPEQATFECGICLEKKLLDDIFRSENCEHELCRVCAQSYLRSLVDDPKLLTCPKPGCKAEWTLFDAEMVLNSEDYNRLTKMLLNKAVVGFVNCPKKDCPGLAEVVPPNRLFICPVCHYHMCSQCRKDWHPTVTCEDYARWLEENGAADERFGDYVKGKKVQVCPVCRQGVEKSEGCNHMTCRCGAHFCYLCGKRFAVKWEEHGGKCPLFEYSNLDLL